MSGNIVKLRLQEGRATTSSGLYQYDYGQKLVFTGAELPETYEVHFSNCQKGLSKTVLGTPEGAYIPDEFLLSGEPVYVWVFLHDTESDGETEYEGVINVTKRARPSTIKARLVQQDIVTKTIAALNAGVETVKDITDDIQETAEEIHTIAEEMPQQIQDALQEAKDSGEFDGFSPIATVEKQDNVATITITDVNGTTTAQVSDGDPTNLIDDTAGQGVTDKVWSADKTLDEIRAISPVIPVFSNVGQNETQCNMTYEEVSEAIRAGKCKVAAYGNEMFYYYLTLSAFIPDDEIIFSLILGSGDGVISAVTIYYFPSDSGNTAMMMSNGITLQTFLAKNYTRITFPVKAGSYCFKDGQFYKAKQDIASYEDWNAAHWQATLIGNELVELDKNKAEQTELASTYSSSSTYAVGDYCTYDGGFYVCTTAISAAEAWTAAHWTAVTVGGELIKASSDSIVPMFSMGQSFGSLICNMSFAEVSAAIIAKKCTSCLCGVVDNVLGFYLFNADSSKIVFATTVDAGVLGIPFAMNMMASYYITYNSDGTATLGIGGLSLESIAQDYSSLTFPIAAGTLCLYQSALYKAKQDIPTQEQWTSLHWQATTIDEQLGLLQTNIDDKADKTDTVLNTTLSHGRKANTTVGEHSVAYGSDVEASEFASHAEGLMTKASGTGAHAEGISTVASGAYAHAEGLSTKATGRFAHSEGWATKAYGGQSHAEGRSTEASGESSHAEGVRAVADGIAMHASGIRPAPSHPYHKWTAGTQYEVGDCVCYNYYGNLNGYRCKIANADNTFDLTKWEEMINTGTSLYDLWQSGTSYEVGDRVRYLYDASPPESNGIECVIANSDVEFDIRKWKMLPSDGDTAFVIGNGIHSGLMFDTEEVSNALKVDWDGNIMLAGDVYVHADYDSRNGVKLATEEELAAKADKADTILDTTLSRGRMAGSLVGTRSFAFGYYVTASQQDSFAIGSNTTASGAQSFASGEYSVASGSNAHAEGGNTQATGNNAHAEGGSTLASGSESHAEGWGTEANKNYAHAEGVGTTASGTGAHAEGNYTHAAGAYSHAEGESQGTTLRYNNSDYDPKARGQASHSEGCNTSAAANYAHAEGYKTIAAGYQSHAEGEMTVAANSSAHAEGLSAVASGIESHAEGYNTEAKGQRSHAEGACTRAFGLVSHAEGARDANNDTRTLFINGTTYNLKYAAAGTYSHSEGANTDAYGTASHAEGNLSIAIGDHSHAEGASTIASGGNGHAEGSGTNAGGGSSHAEGSGTNAGGQSSHAEGSGTNASGFGSHAEGGGTTASGAQSHAEGAGTQATGNQSHAEGGGTTASGANSHAEGGGARATNSNAHAEGSGTTASGQSSHVEGYMTEATKAFQHVFGFTNVSETGSADEKGVYVEIVGNGESPSSRSNARALTWTGDERLMGDVYVGCNADSTGGTRLPHDVQVNGISVVSGGVANIPVGTKNTYGVLKIGQGLKIASNLLYTDNASESVIKNGADYYKTVNPAYQHTAAFYGLAKAAGDSTQSASSNAVGNYTDEAKAAIQAMLGVCNVEVVRLA